MMTCAEAIQYIHSNTWYKSSPGLSRIRTLLAAIGNPQDSVRCIHVGGTNGKGSVCAMLDSVLRAAGYRVGMFTSPYIRCFQERMRADGELIRDEELAEITESKGASMMLVGSRRPPSPTSSTTISTC